MDSERFDPARLVAAGYDAIAERYAAWADVDSWPAPRWAAELDGLLEPGSDVLDLGCGPAVPATRRLARRHRVTGVDVSVRLLELAARALPDARFLEGDALTVELPGGSFSAVVSLYMIDHVPREEHARLLERIHAWLRPGGYLLMTFEIDDLPGVVGQWFGVPMYLSHFDADTNRELVRRAGFELLRDEIESQPEHAREVPYLWVLARKPG